MKFMWVLAVCKFNMHGTSVLWGKQCYSPKDNVPIQEKSGPRTGTKIRQIEGEGKPAGYH